VRVKLRTQRGVSFDLCFHVRTAPIPDIPRVNSHRGRLLGLALDNVETCLVDSRSTLLLIDIRIGFCHSATGRVR